MSLKNNVSVKFESGEVSGSWIPAIDNLGHMKGFVADHYLAVSDRMAGRDQSDAASFGKKIQTIESELAKATEVYAATLADLHRRKQSPRRCRKSACTPTTRPSATPTSRWVRPALTGLADAAGAPDKLAPVQQSFSEKAPDAFRQAYVAMEAILKFNLDGTHGRPTRSRQLVVASDTVMMVVLAVIVVVGGWLMWAIPAQRGGTGAASRSPGADHCRWRFVENHCGEPQRRIGPIAGEPENHAGQAGPGGGQCAPGLRKRSHRQRRDCPGQPRPLQPHRKPSQRAGSKPPPAWKNWAPP